MSSSQGNEMSNMEKQKKGSAMAAAGRGRNTQARLRIVSRTGNKLFEDLSMIGLKRRRSYFYDITSDPYRLRLDCGTDQPRQR